MFNYLLILFKNFLLINKTYYINPNVLAKKIIPNINIIITKIFTIF